MVARNKSKKGCRIVITRAKRARKILGHALSRAPVPEVNSLLLQDEVESFIESVTENLPASSKQLDAYSRAQSLIQYVPG